MARRCSKSERESPRRWPKADGVDSGHRWLVTRRDEYQEFRRVLANTPLDAYMLPLGNTHRIIGPSVRRSATDGIVSGVCEECRRWEATQRRDQHVKAVDEIIADLEARLATVLAGRPSRPRWRPLHQLCACADDHVVADAMLRLALILDEARKRFPTEAKFRSALASDSWLIDCAFRFCHGLEELFVSVPPPACVVSGADLVSDERYLQALRTAYPQHVNRLLSILGDADVVDTLFMTTRERELCGESYYGTGPIKAATITVVHIRCISEGTVDAIRTRLGLIPRRALAVP